MDAGTGVTMCGLNILSTRIVIVAGSGKRKWTRRSGRWLTRSTGCQETPRRLWRSPGSARTRLKELQGTQPRIINDKLKSFNILWAKEGLFSGAGESIKVDSMGVDKSTTTSPEKTSIAEDKEIKPGGSLRAAKDKPGKNIKLCVTNIVLPGPLDVVGGEVLEEGGCGPGGQEMEWSRCPTGPEERSTMMALRPPNKDDSPAVKKSRKRKMKDGLVQARIISNFGPSGGPQIGIKSERGLRGMGDQMEGPAGAKKNGLVKKCPNEPDNC